MTAQWSKPDPDPELSARTKRAIEAIRKDMDADPNWDQHKSNRVAFGPLEFLSDEELAQREADKRHALSFGVVMAFIIVCIVGGALGYGIGALLKWWRP